MAHQTHHSGPCALKDGHAGFCTSVEAHERHREGQRAYQRTPEAIAKRAAWVAAHPGRRAAIVIRYEAKRRGIPR